MSESSHYNAIWLMIGLLLLVYGLLIGGVGFYHVATGTGLNVVLGRLHVDLWWGILMIIVGTLFCITHLPRSGN